MLSTEQNYNKERVDNS